MADRGVFWVATGEAFRPEAIQSISRVSSITDEETAVATDEPNDFDDCPIDHTFTMEKPEYKSADKIKWFGKSPFNRTLYLDTDTYVVDPDAIDEMFSVLDGVDIAAAFDTHKDATDVYLDRHERGYPEVSSPPTFPWLNSGVVAFRDNQRTNEVFSKWRENQSKYESIEGWSNDQAAFREALFTTDVQLGTLPPEYNFRVPFYQYITRDVKLIHGRVENAQQLSEKINQSDGNWAPRIFHFVSVGEKRYPIKMKASKIRIIKAYIKGLLAKWS